MKNLDYLRLLAVVAKSKETLDNAKLRKDTFIRNRKMSFASAISFLLDMRKTTLQTRLNLYFKTTEGGDPISQQAFSKLRMNFDHSPFEKMVREAVKMEYSGEYELPLWQCYHVLAVDGSYLQLPRTDELRLEFGARGGGKATGKQPSAGISVLYDVLHGWPLDPIITHTDMNERSECEKHIYFLREGLPHIAQKSILTIDRGYPSLDLFALLQKVIVVNIVDFTESTMIAILLLKYRKRNRCEQSSSHKFCQRQHLAYRKHERTARYNGSDKSWRRHAPREVVPL